MAPKDGTQLKPPELDTPRYGTISEVAYQLSKQYKHHQVKLVGNWENEGQGHWYANWKAVAALAQAGMLQQQPSDAKKFLPVTSHRFCIWRQAVGGDSKAHDWFVIVYSPEGNEIKLGTFPDPVEPQDTPTAPPAAPTSAPVAPSAPTAAPGPPQAAPAPNRQLTAEELKARDREQLAETAELYATALAIAATEQVRTFRRPTWRIGDQAIQAGAATVLIALRDAGVRLHPGQAKALRKVLHEIEDEYDSERTT